MLAIKQSISSTEFTNAKLSMKLMDFDIWALIGDMCPEEGSHISIFISFGWST